MMQLYKFLSEKNLVLDTIKIIFSFCCTRPFFSQCNKNCKTHDAILNREFPEFHSFKIIDYMPLKPLSKFDQLGFKILLKENGVTADSIKKALIEKGLVYQSHDSIKIIDKEDHVFVNCIGTITYNGRNKIYCNNQPYTCKPWYNDNKKRVILIYDLKEKKIKTRFPFNQDEYVLDCYCADGLFFVTLIGEHVKENILFNELDHDLSFPEPKNHRLQIYDIKSKKLLHTHKLPLPEKYLFGNYNYLLDYADETGYYLYHFPRQTIIHYIKTKTFDIKNESAAQQKVI
jgi:hypothetical protein